MEKWSTNSSEELDKAIFAWMQELAPEGICITDDQLRIRVWNWWLESKSGLSKEKVIGRKLLEVFPDLESRRLHTFFEKALAGEVSVLSVAFHKYLFAFPSPIQNIGFSNMLQSSRIAPLRRNNTLIGTITTIQDVTEREYQNAILRKQHERQELFSWALAHFLQSSNAELMVNEIIPRIAAHIEVDSYLNYLLEDDGKLRLNSAGGIPLAVQQQHAIINVSRETVSGTCALEGQTIVRKNLLQRENPHTQPDAELNRSAQICHPLLIGPKLIGTLSFISRSRAEFSPEDIEFTRTVAQYVAVAVERSRTLTALHDAQEQLGKYAGSLEKTVSERTTEMELSLKALESFSYSLAHDVRAPLRHIRGFAESLREDCKDQLTAEGLQHVDSILRAIQRLDGLTLDIMAYSQVSQSSSSKTPVNLKALLSEIIASNSDLQTPGTLTVKHPLLTPVGDRFLLQQCMVNFLENALKFVPEGVKPVIKVFTESKSGWVRISVEDNGIGIDPEFHQKIFGVFERLPNQQSYNGTGIGLAIVAKATRQMGGRCGVESVPKGGSRFWIELPAAET
jgi:PAS domain S-box-containing protein